MKKILSGVMAFLMCLLLVGSVFVVQKKEKTASAVLSPLYFDENTITNKQDIISATEYKYFAGVTYSQTEAPFDTNTGKQLEGYVYTPAVDENYQLNTSFSVNAFNIDFSQSFFMWIYIPDENVFDLTIALSGVSGNIVGWTIDFDDLADLLNQTKADVSYGWKLFEFSMTDANLFVSEDEVSTSNVTSIKIKYENAGLSVKNSTNKLSIYHAFVGDFVSTGTTVLKTQKLTNFKIKNDFLNKDVFVGDTFSVDSEQEIFETLIVGKYNLKIITNPNFFWEIKIHQDALASEIDYSFGDAIDINFKGWLNIDITLNERLDESSQIVLKKKIQFFVDDFVLGTFQSNNLKIDKNEEKLFVFYFSKSFDYEKGFVATSSDKNIATVTNYYVKDGVGYVAVKGNKGGSVKLSVQADGTRSYGTFSTEKYSTEKTLEVESDDKNSISVIIMWVIFGIYCTSLLIYVIISFVNARRFGVK